MVESSLSTISRPVIGRLNIGRQPSSPAPVRGRKSVGEEWPTSFRESSAATTSTRASSAAPPSSRPDGASSPAPERSRWQTVLLEAGGISAAMSDEHLRRLQYVLQWLQYATARVDAQILALRAGTADPAALRADIVATVRDAVAVVSRYAGGALPEPARATVRAFVLCLPKRLARAVGAAPPRVPAHEGHSVGAAPAATPARRTPYSRPVSPTPASPLSPGSPAGVERVLALATESLDMMRSVTAVVRDSLDRADAWVERFRAVGIQPAPGDGPPVPDGAPPVPDGAGPVPDDDVRVKMEVDA
jgi:hypothetical protein